MPATAAAGAFFDEKQGAAFLKHELLRSYVPVFFSKTGSRSRGNAGVYLDGYAGPGTYDDDSPGSPAVAVAALEPLSKIRDVRCVFVERNASTFTELEKLCGNDGFEHTKAVRGEVADHIDDVLAMAAGLPLFAFFDPFGMGLPLDTLHQALRRSSGVRRVPTEVLLNFSLPGLYRTAGHLTSEGKDPTYLRARATIISKLDAHLGGDWWQPIWRTGAPDRVERIFEGYLERLRLPGWGSYGVSVSDRWDGPPVYYLVLLTQHRDGMWLFNEGVSRALERYFEWSHRLQRSLITPEMLRAEWEDEIVRNAERLLAEEPEFIVQKRLQELLGNAFGHARETHIRAALKRLEEDGKILGPVKGSLQRFPVRRA